MKKHTRHKSHAAKSHGSHKTHSPHHTVKRATVHGSKEDMRWQTPVPKEFPTETMTSETQPAGEEGGPTASEEVSSQEKK